MNLEQFLKFDSGKVIHAAYLLAGLPAVNELNCNRWPPLVSNYVNLIKEKYGADAIGRPKGMWEKGPSVSRDTINRAEFQELLEQYGAAPAQNPATPAPVVSETKEQRQDRRLQTCIDAGLPMNTKAALSRLPDGVGEVADREGVTRQSFSTDVKAALERRERAKKDGLTVNLT